MFEPLFRGVFPDDPPSYPLSDRGFYGCSLILLIVFTWHITSFAIMGLRMYHHGFVFVKDIVATLCNTWNIYCAGAFMMAMIFLYETNMPIILIKVLLLHVIGFASLPLVLAYFFYADFMKYETMRFPIDFNTDKTKKQN